jgi:Concanavalin A-like lectin/glucanases superfamily
VRRSAASRPVHVHRPGRLALLLGTAALGVGLLAAPASADTSTGTPPTAPVVTPSTTGPVDIGSPMTMTIAPGSATDHVYGYAWTWQPSSNAPTYTSLPSCGAGDATGVIHFVCGSSVTVRVSPEDPPFARFTVWAFDAAGNRSAGTTTSVNVTHDVTALYPVTHQWTTDQFWMVPPPANCGLAALTLDCVPDTAGVDARHPNGASPLLLPPGVTWDGSGGGVPGVLTFGSGNRLPAGTLGAVVDTRRSFTAGAWLTPTTTPAGAAATALAQEGAGGTGFELGLTADGHWQFRVHGPSALSAAIAPGIAAPGSAVYVAGVADAVNHEVRLYVNGGLAADAGFAPARGHSPDGVAAVGGRLAGSGVADRWTGQIGNPVLAEAALTPTDQGLLSFESFFPGGDGGLG